MEARFYLVNGNLPADIEAVLPGLLGKITSSGQKVLLVAADAAVARLDERLWPAGSGFLPHGRVGEGDEARQAVLLSRAADMPGYAQGRLPVIMAGAEDAFENKPENLVYLYHGAVADSAARRRGDLAKNGWNVSFFQQTAQGWRKVLDS